MKRERYIIIINTMIVVVEHLLRRNRNRNRKEGKKETKGSVLGHRAMANPQFHTARSVLITHLYSFNKLSLISLICCYQIDLGCACISFGAYSLVRRTCLPQTCTLFVCCCVARFHFCEQLTKGTYLHIILKL